MKSKVILVTGASSGIGAACALHLARAGHRVVGVSRSGTVPAGPENLSPRVLDIRDLAAVERGRYVEVRRSDPTNVETVELFLRRPGPARTRK